MTRNNYHHLFRFILVSIFISSYIAELSYYEILGVKRNASTSEIKMAFRKLSKQHHPDIPGGNSAKYMEINEAYEALSNDDMRRKYDRFGKEGLKQTPQQQNHGDIFGNFFGGGAQREEELKGTELGIDLFVSLEDIYTGRDIEIVLTKKTVCSHCRGSGADNPDDVKVCDKCSGRGVYMEVRQMGPGFIQQTQTTCPKCKGAGRIHKSKCHVCQGTKVLDDLETYRFTVEKGMEEGQKVTLYNSAADYVEKSSSDLVFTIKIKPHPFFTRVNSNDLLATVKISLKEALMGFKKKIRHLDGDFVTIENAGITQPNETKIYRGKGLPKNGYTVDKGNLIVKFIVELPAELSRKEKELWIKFFNS